MISLVLYDVNAHLISLDRRMGRNPDGGSVQHGEAWSAGLLGLPVCGTEQDADKALFVSPFRTSPAFKAQLDTAPVVMRYVLSSLVSFGSCQVGSTRNRSLTFSVYHSNKYSGHSSTLQRLIPSRGFVLTFSRS